MTKKIISLISERLSVSETQVSATVELLQEGSTIPFISRYRKEATGSLDEIQVAAIEMEMKKLTELAKRKEYIVKIISDKEQMTNELSEKISNCWDPNELEDIYLPFKPKRKTRATAAKEKGLEPLAGSILSENVSDPVIEAAKFLNDKVASAEEALAGAGDIIAEWISEDAAARNILRKIFEQSAVITSKVIAKKKDEGEKYMDYFDYAGELNKCPAHRFLAILRGEQNGILRVSIGIDNIEAQLVLEKMFIKNKNVKCAELVKEAIKDSYKRLISPSIETEFRNTYKEKADAEAIKVFSGNLRQLLLAAPLGPSKTMAIDPGFRTGCKVVCLDEQGSLLHSTTIYPHPPKDKIKESEEMIRKLIDQFNIKAIAIGNGTAGRETDSFIRSVLKNAGMQGDVEVYMVNEAGASIYSASEIARQEFPALDLTVRGAISIGRRLMDPLAELVKIDPKSIGVGQYQHDVDQDKLKDSLDMVVSFAVNQVGVNLNTSSTDLLKYVSGIGPKIAGAIIKYRQDHGPFKSRKELLKVTGLGNKVFEQAAGFLRIPGAKDPLDDSAVHPESYYIVNKMSADINKPVRDIIGSDEICRQIVIKNYISDKAGLPTLEDIMNELKKPGLDPRGKAEAFSFSETIKDISDLKENMHLPGIITNITKFGAFVNIGIKENGLLHVSQISGEKFIKDPSEVLKLDQKVMVRIVNIDTERKRIQLSMIDGK